MMKQEEFHLKQFDTPVVDKPETRVKNKKAVMKKPMLKGIECGPKKKV